MSTDSAIMLRRNFKHTVRNPVAVFNAVLLPIVIMLMFVGEIGGAFNVGVKYVDYATPGMIVLTICYGLSATALAVNSDMAKGIINRFKVMDISRSAVLSAQVAATMLRIARHFNPVHWGLSSETSPSTEWVLYTNDAG